MGVSDRLSVNNERDTSPALPPLRPPVYDFAPPDDGDPAEVDAFNAMIRELRNQSLHEADRR